MRALFLLLLASLQLTDWMADATPVFGGERFPVYWNFPWDACKEKKHEIPVAKFKIIHNTDFTFMGDRVNTFYEYKNGLFPFFTDGKAEQPVNGGLPQNLNLAAHLSTLEGHILTHIKDANYSGPAMLDVEEWRPMLHMNWKPKDVYARESIKLVKKRFPSISDKGAHEAATKEFNAAARKILVTSFRLAKRLRPHAKWGLYGFPLQDFKAGKKDETDMHVGENFQDHNDKLRWLYDELTLLTPSIYLGEDSSRRMWHPDAATANYRYVHAHMFEARRIANWYSPPKPVMPYTKFEYNPYSKDFSQFKYYSKIDACNTLKLAADFGAEGAIIWSTFTNLGERCEKIMKAFEDFGPIVESVRGDVGRCSVERCSGNGNCVNKLRSQTQACKFEMPLEEFECLCDVGFHGEKCELVDEKKEEL